MEKLNKNSNDCDIIDICVRNPIAGRSMVTWIEYVGDDERN